MDSDQTPEQRRLAQIICAALDLDPDVVVDMRLNLQPNGSHQVRAVLRIRDDQWARLVDAAEAGWL